MSPSAVVVALDILKDLGPDSLSCAQWLAVNGLLFQRCKETFCHGVVPTVAPTTHALHGLEVRNLLDEAGAAILTPLVAVYQYSFGLATHEHGRLQRVTHQLGVYAFTELPAHHPATEQVNKDGQIQPTLRCPEVGDVAHPHSVGGTHDKLARQVIRHHCMGVPGIGRAFEFLRVASPQPKALHAPAHRTDTAHHPRLLQRMRNAGSARPGFVLLELALNGLIKWARRFVSVTPCVVATATDLQGGAQRTQAVAPPIRLHKRVPHRFAGLAKYTVAFFRMSLTSCKWAT